MWWYLPGLTTSTLRGRMETISIIRIMIMHPVESQREILFADLYWGGQRSLSSALGFCIWLKGRVDAFLQYMGLKPLMRHRNKVSLATRLSCKNGLSAMVSPKLCKYKSQLASPPQWGLLAWLCLHSGLTWMRSETNVHNKSSHNTRRRGVTVNPWSQSFKRLGFQSRLTWSMWWSQSFVVFQDREKCDEEVNEGDSLSKSVKPAVQTGHFVRTVVRILDAFNAFLTPRRLSIQMISIWAGGTFRFVASMHLNCDSSNNLLQFRPEHRLPPRGVSVAFSGFLTCLYVGVNVCLRVAAPSVLHQSPTDSQWQLKNFFCKLSQSHPHRWVDLRQWPIFQ